MDPDPSSLPLLLAFALLTANAFLVSAEFAPIPGRRARIEQNVRLGDSLSLRVLPPLDRLEELVFAAQIARSTASVGLGWVAVEIARQTLVPLGVIPWAATLLAVGAVVLLHATLGQQVP